MGAIIHSHFTDEETEVATRKNLCQNLSPNLSGSRAGGCLSSGHPIKRLGSASGAQDSWELEACALQGRWHQPQGAAWGWAVARSVTAHIVLVGSHGTHLGQQLLSLPFPACLSLSSSHDP